MDWFVWQRTWTSAHGSEHFGSIKCEESIDYQGDCLFLKRDIAALSKHISLI